MFQLDVLQNQWVALSLFGGVALVLVMILSYLALWRARGGESGTQGTAGEPASPARGRPRLPWVLILVYAATVVFAIVYVALRAANPPNW